MFLDPYTKNKEQILMKSVYGRPDQVDTEVLRGFLTETFIEPTDG